MANASSGAVFAVALKLHTQISKTYRGFSGLTGTRENFSFIGSIKESEV